MTAPTVGATPLPARASAWLVPVLALSAFVTMVHAMALAPLMPAIATDLDTSVAWLGQISAASMLLAGLLGVLSGPLIDRFGHRRSMASCLIAAVISALGMAAAPAYLPLLLAALFGAIGRAVVQPVALVIAGNHFQDAHQRRAISWVMAGVTGSPVVGVPALTAVAGAFGWRAALVALALTTALLVPLVYRVTSQEGADPGEATSVPRFLAAYRPILRHPPTLGLIFATLLGNASTWVIGTYIGAFYADRHDFSTGQIGWVFFVTGVAIFAGNLAAGGRMGALPLRPIVALTRLAVGVLATMLFMLPVSAGTGLALLGAIGLMIGVASVGGVLLLIQGSPGSRATTLTLNTVALSLGLALGSTVGGALLAVSGFAALGLGALALGAGSALTVWRSGESTSRPTAPSSATAHTS